MASDAKIVPVTALARTSIGDQTFAGPAGTGQPSAVIFCVSGGDVLGTARVNAHMGYGVTDGVGNYATSGATVNGVTAKSKTGTMQSNTDCVLITTANSVPGRAQFLAWTADGITIHWSAASASADWQITAYLIVGVDVINADVGNFTLPVAAPSTVTLTPGFNADAVFLLSNNQGDFLFSTNSADQMSFGLALNQVGIPQHCVGYHVADNVSTTINNVITRNDSAGVQIGANVQDYKLTVGNFTATTFDVTKDASGATDIFGYLALKFANNPDLAIYDVTIPKTTGDYIETAPGFTPVFSMLSLAYDPTAVNTFTTVSGVEMALIGFDDTTTSSIEKSDLDGASTTNAHSFQDSRVMLRDVANAGTVLLDETSHVFTANGHTVTIATHPAKDILGWGFSIGAGGGGGGTTFPFIKAQTLLSGLAYDMNRDYQMGAATSLVVGRAMAESRNFLTTKGQVLAVAKAPPIERSFAYTKGQTLLSGVAYTLSRTMSYVKGQTLLQGGAVQLTHILDFIKGAVLLSGKTLGASRSFAFLKGSSLLQGAALAGSKTYAMAKATLLLQGKLFPFIQGTVFQFIRGTVGGIGRSFTALRTVGMGKGVVSLVGKIFSFSQAGLWTEDSSKVDSWGEEGKVSDSWNEEGPP